MLQGRKNRYEIIPHVPEKEEKDAGERGRDTLTSFFVGREKFFDKGDPFFPASEKDLFEKCEKASHLLSERKWRNCYIDTT